jgi:hypothetical protein
MKADAGASMHSNLRAFVDRVIVPALLERFLREQAGEHTSTTPPMRPAA